MKNRQTISLALAIGAGSAFVAPLAAYAEGPSHFAPTEAGVVYHPNEAGPSKSEAEVSAELASTQRILEGANLLRWGVMATPKVGPAKTSAEVAAELETAQTQPGWDAPTRLGAPLAAPKGDASKARTQAQP